jgi:hypothetical protein
MAGKSIYRNRWGEERFMKLKIGFCEKCFQITNHDEKNQCLKCLPDGIPCSHIGCLNHLSHPCELCGRIGGIRKNT